MLKISDFSRLARIPAKTLRYYDEIGLFAPAHIDRFTGYRYYALDQLPRLYRILALKSLGLSLDEIRRLLAEDLPAEQIRGMLRRRQAEIQQRLEEEQMRLQFVEFKLQQLEQEGNMFEYEVVLKSVPAYRVASIQTVTPDWPHIGVTLDKAFDTVADYIRSHGARISDNSETCGITIYLDPEYRETDIQLEAAIGYEGDLSGSDQVQVYDLPALDQVASVIHHGSLSTVEKAYDAVLRWIEDNGYEITGPNREINLEYERGGDESQYVTEIQFPVRIRHP